MEKRLGFIDSLPLWNKWVTDQIPNSVFDTLIS